MNQRKGTDGNPEREQPSLPDARFPGEPQEPERQMPNVQIGSLRALFTRSNVLRHVLTLVSGTASAQLILVLLYPVLLRVYSEHDYGVLALYISVTSFLSTLAALRYDLAIMLPDEHSDAVLLRRTVVRMIVGTTAITTVALVIFRDPVAALMRRPEIAPFLPVAGIATFVVSLVSMETFWLNRLQKYRSISLSRIIQSGMTVILQLALGVLTGIGPWGLVLGLLLGQSSGLLVLWRQSRRSRFGISASRATAISLLRRYHRMPLFNCPNAIVDAVRLNGITILVGAFFSVGALGQFSIAWGLLQAPITLINSALSQVAFQRFSTVPRGQMFTLARRSVTASAAVGAIPFLLIFLWAPVLTPWAFGQRWIVAGQIAQVLVPWLYLNLITQPLSTLFIAAEAQHVLLCFSVVYGATPLLIIWRFHQAITSTALAMSLAMAALLVVMVLLAFVVASRYDSVPEGASGSA